MCLRRTLESYIRMQQSNILRKLMKMKKQAIIELESDLISEINTLEGTINTLKPLVSNYQKPEDYVRALKTYALAYSYISSLIEIEMALVELLEKATNIATTVKTAKETDIQTVIEVARAEFKDHNKSYLNKYTEATRRYLSTIIQNCGPGSLDQQDQQLLKDTIIEIIVEEPRPYITTDELGAKIGIEPNKLDKIAEEIAKNHREVIKKKNILTTETKLFEWINSRQARREEIDVLKKHFPEQLEKTYYQSIEKSINKLKQLVK